MRAIVLALSFTLLAGGAQAAPPHSPTAAALPSPPGAATPAVTPPAASRFLGNGSGSPYVANNAGEFAQACKGDASSCSSMVGQVLLDRMQFSPTSHICLSGLSYAEAVAPWIAAHPQVAQMPARDGIYLALTDLYKCGRPNNY
jgi:hypothetical protein